MRLIGWRKISDKIDHKRSWIYAKVKAGEFPLPLDLPDMPGKALWSEEEVDRWIEGQVAAAKARAESRVRKASADARPAA